MSEIEGQEPQAPGNPQSFAPQEKFSLRAEEGGPPVSKEIGATGVTRVNLSPTTRLVVERPEGRRGANGQKNYRPGEHGRLRLERRPDTDSEFSLVTYRTRESDENKEARLTRAAAALEELGVRADNLATDNRISEHDYVDGTADGITIALAREIENSSGIPSEWADALAGDPWVARKPTTVTIGPAPLRSSMTMGHATALTPVREPGERRHESGAGPLTITTEASTNPVGVEHDPRPIAVSGAAALAIHHLQQ